MEIKEYVAKHKLEIAEEIKALGFVPTLSIIAVGENPASEAYIRGKTKDAAEVGINALVTRFPEDVEEKEVLDFIRKQNGDPSIQGILVQLPVPKQISEKHINDTIIPSKDVDGFVPESAFECCTPKGIVDYLTSEGFVFRGANAVVLGRSQIVGKPMAKMLLARDCNVTVLHSKTKEEDKAFYLAHADLIVVAIGREAIVDSHYSFKESAVIVDVGINRGADGKLHGDCERGLPVRLQTPVPGGVGLLTRIALMDNLLKAAK